MMEVLMIAFMGALFCFFSLCVVGAVLLYKTRMISVVVTEEDDVVKGGEDAVK